MSKAKRLPADVFSFSDSPIRKTTEAPTEAPAVPHLASVDRAPPRSEVSMPAAPAADADRRGRQASAERQEDPLIKRSVYVPATLLQALEDEVYRRRRGGDRSCDFGELHREILAQWVTRRAKRGLAEAE